MQAIDEEETPNEVSIIIAKRNRKYLKMMHGQCCSDNCGCCPNLKPPKAPGPHDAAGDSGDGGCMLLRAEYLRYIHDLPPMHNCIMIQTSHTTICV
jgi:hypothetical protein